jgi:hypothetical protein
MWMRQPLCQLRLRFNYSPPSFPVKLLFLQVATTHPVVYRLYSWSRYYYILLLAPYKFSFDMLRPTTIFAATGSTPRATCTPRSCPFKARSRKRAPNKQRLSPHVYNGKKSIYGVFSLRVSVDGIWLFIDFTIWISLVHKCFLRANQAVGSWWWPNAPIIRDAHDISVHFSEFKLLYSSRSCNRVAHTLAKQVTGDTTLGEWQYAPSYVVGLVTVDCNPDESWMNGTIESQKKIIIVCQKQSSESVSKTVTMPSIIKTSYFQRTVFKPPNWFLETSFLTQPPLKIDFQGRLT